MCYNALSFLLKIVYECEDMPLALKEKVIQKYPSLVLAKNNYTQTQIQTQSTMGQLPVPASSSSPSSSSFSAATSAPIASPFPGNDLQTLDSNDFSQKYVIISSRQPLFMHPLSASSSSSSSSFMISKSDREPNAAVRAIVATNSLPKIVELTNHKNPQVNAVAKKLLNRIESIRREEKEVQERLASFEDDADYPYDDDQDYAEY